RLRIDAPTEGMAASTRSLWWILVDLRLGQLGLERNQRVDHLLVFAEEHVAVVRRDVDEHRDLEVIDVIDRRALDILVDAIVIVLRSTVLLERQSLNPFLGGVVPL